jgi:predicted acetyltransferase
VYRTFERPNPQPGPNQRLEVRDFIALDMDAYQALWEYIRGHDLVREVFMGGVVPEDDPAADLLSEPRMLNRRLGDAIWMRVVDAERALAARPYGAAGSLTIEVVGDQICPWNARVYHLETDGPNATVTQTTAAPDLRMPVNTLAGLIAGYRPARHYHRIERLEAVNPAAIELADRIFRTEYAPFTPNEF